MKENDIAEIVGIYDKRRNHFKVRGRDTLKDGRRYVISIEQAGRDLHVWYNALDNTLKYQGDMIKELDDLVFYSMGIAENIRQRNGR